MTVERNWANIYEVTYNVLLAMRRENFEPGQI